MSEPETWSSSGPFTIIIMDREDGKVWRHVVHGHAMKSRTLDQIKQALHNLFTYGSAEGK